MSQAIHLQRILELLIRYRSSLRANAQFNLLNDHIYAEDFFCRLLNRIEPSWQLKNYNLIKKNVKGIDLVDDKNGIVIQVSAINSGFETKVIDSLNEYIDKWQNKYSKFYVLLICLEHQTDIDKIKNIKFNSSQSAFFDPNESVLSVKKIVEIIKSKNSKELEIEIECFLKNEIEDFNNFNTLRYIEPLKNLFFEVPKFLTSESYIKNDWLYFDEKTSDLIKCIKNDVLKYDRFISQNFLLLGDPCSGKSSVAYYLLDQLNIKENGDTLYKSFYFNISNNNINIDGLIEDLKQLNYHYSFLVIDNVQDNVNLAYKLLNNLSDKYFNIKTLFLSRKLERYSDNIFESSTLKNKFSSQNIFELDSFEVNKTEQIFEGVISKRIKYLKQKYENDNIKWSYNSLDAILSNCKNNLLALNISLYIWEETKGSIAIENISESDILKYFYEYHSISKVESALKDYSLVYSYNTPFQIPSKLLNEKKIIIDKGFCKKQLNSELEYYIFYHTSYADLIYSSILFNENVPEKFVTTEKTKTLENYINSFLPYGYPNNLNLLFANLHINKDNSVFEGLISTNCIKDVIKNFNENEKVDALDYASILNSLSNAINDSNKKVVELIVDDIVNSENFPKEQLSFSYDAQVLESSLKRLSQKLKLNKRLRYEYLEDSKLRKKVESAEIKSIAWTISSKGYKDEYKKRLLSTLNFNEWKNKFLSEKNITSFTDALTALNKYSYSKILAHDIYVFIDPNYIYERIKDLSIDKIGLCLNRLNKFKGNDNGFLPKLILQNLNLYPKFTENILNENSLSKFSIGLSHLSEVNKAFISNLFENIPDNILKIKIEDENDLNNLSQRIHELIKVQQNGSHKIQNLSKGIFNEAYIYSILSKPQTVLGIIRFLSLLKTLSTSRNIISILESKLPYYVATEKNILFLSEAANYLKNDSLTLEGVFNVINKDSIQDNLKAGNFKFTHLEQLFVSFLVKASPVKANELFISLSNNILINSAKNACRFEQIAKTLYRLHVVDSNKNGVSDKSKCKEIYSEMILKHNSFLYQEAINSDIFSLILGFTYFYKIESNLTVVNFENIILDFEKNNVEFKGVLSEISQILKNYIFINIDKNKIIAKSIFIKTEANLINTSRVSDLKNIATALSELVEVLPEETDILFSKLEDDIISKCKSYPKNKEYYEGIIPELKKASGILSKDVMKKILLIK